MTKKEYAQARDDFAKAAKNLQELICWFDLPDEHMEEHDWDMYRALNEYGYYMTGAEYERLMECSRFLESLAGRNAARAL